MPSDYLTTWSSRTARHYRYAVAALDEDVSLESLGRGRWQGRLSDRWNIGAGINGGYLASFVLASKTENGRLFPIGRVRAFEIIRDAALAAGVTAPGARGIHPHVFRHSFAVHCLNQGVPINIVKELLGHASILTTMVYLRVVPADLRAFLARVEF